MRTDLVISPFAIEPGEVVAAAIAAERAGFAAVWTYDHLSGSVVGAESCLEVWTTLGAIGQATGSIGIGPLVANVTTRHPAVTAVAAATLARLAPGRVSVGIGAGAGPGSPFGTELDMIGEPRRSARERRKLVREAVGAMRALWTGTGTYTGDLVRIENADGFLAVDPPPVIVGCNGPLMARVAGSCADGANFHAEEEELERLVAAARSVAPGPLEISVEAPQRASWDEWLDPTSAQRRRLDSLGVSRLMLVWRAGDGLQAIAAAARYLGGSSHTPAR